MTGYLFLAALVAAAVIVGMVAWALRDDDWHDGRDLAGFPLRAVKGIELRDAIAADQGETRTETEG